MFERPPEHPRPLNSNSATDTKFYYVVDVRGHPIECSLVNTFLLGTHQFFISGTMNYNLMNNYESEQYSAKDSE